MNQYSNETFATRLPFERLVEIVVPAIFTLIICIGVVGNLLVIIVFTVYRALQDSTNLLIINLACADLMFLFLCVPFTAMAYAKPNWPWHSFWCLLSSYLQHVSAYASVWTLVMLAFDRFLAVVLPIRSLSLRTSSKTFVLLLFVWFLLFATNLHVLKTTGIFRYEFAGENRTACVPYLDMIDQKAAAGSVKAFYLGFNIAAFMIPLGVTSVFYFLLVRKLWQGSWHRFSPETLRLKRRVTLLLVLVTVVFALCWLPLNVKFLLNAVEYPSKPDNSPARWMFQVLAQILAYTNSCLNPLLYGIVSENFRLGLSNLMRVAVCQKARNLISKGSLQENEHLQMPNNSDDDDDESFETAGYKAVEHQTNIMLQVIRSISKSSSSRSRRSELGYSCDVPRDELV